MTDILALIARLPFRAARAKDRWGHPQVPHEYTVRAKGGTVEDYEALFDLIQRDGVDERFGRARRKYLYVGSSGHKYWAMTTDRSESQVINRMRVGDDADGLRREGQPVRDEQGRIVEKGCND